MQKYLILCQFYMMHVYVYMCFKLVHSPACFVPMQGGFINSLMFSHNGESLVVGVGQEHRLGRWWTDKSVKNTVTIIPLKHTV